MDYSCCACKESKQKHGKSSPYLVCGAHDIILHPNSYWAVKISDAILKPLCPITGRLVRGRMKKSKLRKNLDLLYFELKKGIIESESERVSLKYKYEEAIETRNKLLTEKLRLVERINRYENMGFRQRFLFLFKGCG